MRVNGIGDQWPLLESIRVVSGGNVGGRDTAVEPTWAYLRRFSGSTDRALDGLPDEVLQQAMGQAVAGFPALGRMGSYDGTPFTDKNCKQNYLQFWGRGPGLTGCKSLIRVSADPQQSDTDIDHGRIKCPTQCRKALRRS